MQVDLRIAHEHEDQVQALVFGGGCHNLARIFTQNFYYIYNHGFWTPVPSHPNPDLRMPRPGYTINTFSHSGNQGAKGYLCSDVRPMLVKPSICEYMCFAEKALAPTHLVTA